MLDNYELLDIAEKLLDKYGNGRHWQITHAESYLNGRQWHLTVELLPEEKEGAEDESNK